MWPDGDVVVDEVGQVVGDEVLAGDPQVHGVPVLKLRLKLVQGGAGDAGRLGERLALVEDVVPNLSRHLLRPRDPQNDRTYVPWYNFRINKCVAL